ncbi:hypothetical protein IVB30_38480 [Bradyrhizobium sp. 200]|uniref:hypothetical protein n=1 Tax=Bradyrhizobium sp. 200 TaxID=2782665 RepID=UPI001FFEDE5A|nr:hypothetical protein [Bradyrhizobium sp. 200]UPJ48826.1 hypothetical protein IVB30_38480 [Bradyrhizobium sp. 200]
MDNKLNEIRRKIRFLRAEMLSAEDNIRKRVNRDEDCSEAAVHLMSMRVAMLGLIGERNRLGGEERLLNVDERLKLDVRAVSRKPSNGAPMRFPAKASPGLDPGWEPVRVTKTRQIKNLESRSDSIGTEKARGRRER